MRECVLLVVLCLASLLLGCLDEDKTGCRADGDCQGVRVCEEGVCETPSDVPDVGFAAGATDGGDLDALGDLDEVERTD